MRKRILLFLFVFIPGLIYAQLFNRSEEFTRQDTLRGAITPERAWWDVTFYHLSVEVNLEDSTFSGSNRIQYRVLESASVMQIDLQEPMVIERVTQAGKELRFEREGNAFFIQLNQEQQTDRIQELDVFFSGKPKKAVRAPWDGGVTWTRDQNGKPFIATANQGIGASIWWPNKDHGYDEPDSMAISITVPDSLMDISNGRLLSVEDHDNGTRTWHWYVTNPINNYGVNINIGDYEHFGEIIEGEKGELTMDYYVIRGNKERAISHFSDAPRTIKALEYWFGPYPFYEDGFKLVQVPYLGMEHQSSVTYGNQFKMGYLGRDLSMSGWGLKFDFIIIHETGHEWFANSLTSKDVADLWVHEGFTSYSEGLFVEFFYGKEAGAEYVRGVRLNISNREPLIGIYDVHYEGSSDMYNKGSNLLHTIRTLIGNDDTWRQILRGLSTEFYHQTVTTRQVEEYISEKAGLDLSKVFDQYLRDPRVPILEYAIQQNQLLYRWANTIPGFDMNVRIRLNEKEQWLEPQTSWQAIKLSSSDVDLTVDPDFYVGTMNVTGN
ncbi:MAG: M1 family metallopeptidase [Bacteroidota bacterium]